MPPKTYPYSSIYRPCHADFHNLMWFLLRFYCFPHCAYISSVCVAIRCLVRSPPVVVAVLSFPFVFVVALRHCTACIRHWRLCAAWHGVRVVFFAPAHCVCPLEWLTEMGERKKKKRFTLKLYNKNNRSWCEEQASAGRVLFGRRHEVCSYKFNSITN